MADRKLIKQLKKQILESLANDEWTLAKGTGSCEDHHYFRRGDVEVRVKVSDGTYEYVFGVEVKGVGGLDSHYWQSKLCRVIKKRWATTPNENVLTAIKSLLPSK